MLDTRLPYVPYLDILISPRFENLELMYSNPATQVFVYRATYYPRVYDTGIRVALKVLFRDIRDPTKKGAYRDERIRREIAVLSDLCHPNIVRILEAGPAREHYFIAMELFETTLAHRFADARRDHNRRLSLRSTLAKVYQVACGLSVAHAAGVVHRDIKPENIFLDTTSHDGQPQRAVLGDFGVAWCYSWSHITGEHAAVGTVIYMAPESLMDSQFTPQSDIFSLGAVMYECLTGTPPWPNPGYSGINRISNDVHLPAPDIRTIRPDLPENVAAIVNSATSIDPRDRQANAYVFALQVLAADRSLPRSQDESGPIQSVSFISINRRLPNAWEEDRPCIRCRGTGWIHSEEIIPDIVGKYWGCIACGGDHDEPGHGYIRGVSLAAFREREWWMRVIWLLVALIFVLLPLALILAYSHFHH